MVVATDVARVASSALGRERALDGLRGLAAFVVVVHHALLSVPALAEGNLGLTPGSASNRWTRLLIWSPLHTVWAGGEAVFLFFILSGYVLLRWQVGRMEMRSYYPQRLARLYLPVIPAVFIGTLLVVLVPRTGNPAFGMWIAQSPSASMQGALHDLTLVAGTSGAISPLWSLKFEVLYSLVAPVVGLVVMWWAAKRAGRLSIALVGLALVGVAVTAQIGSGLRYFAMFALGAALLPVLDRSIPRLLRIGVGWGWLAFVIALLLFCARWWSGVTNAVLPALGSTLLLALGLGWLPAKRALESRAVQWLGVISFSLYLVHEPIVISIALLLGPGRGPWVLPIALPVALAAGWLFWRLVEAPAHRDSRLIGAWAARVGRAAPIGRGTWRSRRQS